MENLHFDHLYTELSNILKSKSVNTLFQPIVSLKNGEVLGYEALSRGPKNSFFYNPLELFNTAKQYNLLWDLECVCRQKALENASNNLNDKKLFINIDPDIIQDKNFKQGFTKELLKKYNINPNDVIFEITENTSIKDLKSLRNILDNYTEQGYNIALDDTGSGYSGLLILAETRPNYIKMDMELIRDIDKNKFKKDLLATFREFAQNTRVHIIAEGIETEDELKTLIGLGIEYGQGYLLQRPNEKIKDIDRDIVEMIKSLNSKNELLEVGGTEDFCIGFLARKDSYIELNTTVEEVNDIFSYNYRLQGIPVVSERRPVGLVMRNKFYYQILKKSYVEINNKSIETIMTKLPLIIDYDAPVKKVANLAMSRREECTYDYVIVVKDNEYFGIVTILDILDLLSR
ncbi:EAL domain-containing protein [Brassicibacter mesophilus]|uniref:EAL domain-containing protein n=1 Tax=Brassicibacter mesophilus TaxID=745119 RepID=UPI003D252F91